MSLQVWLPLNGDLHNQGLSNITVTNNGATIDNNGKIGKCYRFGTAKSFLELPVEAMNDFTTECTVSFWLKILTRNTGWDTYFQAGLGGTPWNNYVFGFLRNNSNKCCFTVSGEAGTSSGSFVTSDMELDTWYHITLVYQTGHCLIYMDGMLYHDYSTAIVPAFNNITTITIGCANTKTNYQSNCLLNDLRIYDHALSPLEVKHLAQGLVLHYPLSDAYIESTANLLPLSVQNFNCTNNDAIAFSYDTSQHGKYTLSGYITRNPTTNGTWVSPRITIGAKYSSGTDTMVQDWNSLIDDGKERFINLTITTDSSRTLTKIYVWILDHSSGTTGSKNTIGRNMQLEFKDHATPYTSSTRNENIVYDTSGFCNNGTINGQFSISADTPRYNVSTYASGSASTYLSGSTLPTEAKTVSLWIKCNKTVDSAIFSDKTSGLQIGLLHSLLYINSLASTPGFTTTHWVNDEWNHVVAINDNGNRSVYINGQPETQSGASNYYIHNNDNFYLWKREYNNYYTYTGALSDLRIYATALSADDVMALYKNAGYVDSDGNVYAYEITE